jgi:hypothetical protein
MSPFRIPGHRPQPRFGCSWLISTLCSHHTCTISPRVGRACAHGPCVAAYGRIVRDSTSATSRCLNRLMHTFPVIGGACFLSVVDAGTSAVPRRHPAARSMVCSAGQWQNPLLCCLLACRTQGGRRSPAGTSTSSWTPQLAQPCQQGLPLLTMSTQRWPRSCQKWGCTSPASHHRR